MLMCRSNSQDVDSMHADVTVMCQSVSHCDAVMMGPPCSKSVQINLRQLVPFFATISILNISTKVSTWIRG